jgi:hypothetical protein
MPPPHPPPEWLKIGLFNVEIDDYITFSFLRGLEKGLLEVLEDTD